ncbi:hypothetical protein V6N13_033815 [Hibiscus sabdariffa]|uniref:Uncharacterized protein n=1 Tax=Hibiscus sabdariffa TaxID=183260 RepID=A0ABR2F9F4_9ROSI
MAEFQSKQYKSGAKAWAKGKGHGFSTKCASLVKQQRARLYILRRCATMLLCWLRYDFIDHAKSPFGSIGHRVWNINKNLPSFLCVFDLIGVLGEQEKFMATPLHFHQAGIEHDPDGVSMIRFACCSLLRLN